MTSITLNEDLIRQFLLGQLDDDKRRRVEEAFLCDAEARQRILIGEEDLIDDYLDNLLSPTENELFLKNYLTSPQQKQRLETAKSLRAFVETESALQEKTWWRKIPLFDQPRTLIPVAVVVAIVLISGVLWLVRTSLLEAEQRNRRAAVEREAEQANSPDAIAATNPAEVVTFVLSPYSTRERAPRVMLKPGINMLDLWLLRSADEGLRKYEAQVVLVGGEDPFTIRNLHVEPRPEGNAIRVRIPTRLLKRGTYQIELKAGSQNEEPKTISEFTLHVGG
jgi:hypothetical protein